MGMKEHPQSLRTACELPEKREMILCVGCDENASNLLGNMNHLMTGKGRVLYDEQYCHETYSFGTIVVIILAGVILSKSNDNLYRKLPLPPRPSPRRKAMQKKHDIWLLFYYLVRNLGLRPG